MPRLNYDEDKSGATPSGPQWQRAVSGAGAAIGMGVILMLVFAAGYAILHHHRKIPILRNQVESGSRPQAKPSPAIPWSPKPQVAPPPIVAPLPADSVPTAIAEASTPGAAPVMVKAKDTEGVYTARHQKIFGRGCEGRLELRSTGLDFACASGSEAPLHFPVAQIKGANGNGIELKTGAKYHFEVQRSKREEQEIFRDWVYTHVPGAYAKAVSK
jgi:hypothetical protein